MNQHVNEKRPRRTFFLRPCNVSKYVKHCKALELHFVGRQRKKPKESQNACFVIRLAVVTDVIWLTMPFI
jgi:hypothetical protein